MNDPRLDVLAQRGKRELIRTMRDINSYLDAYIKLSIRACSELVKVDPKNKIFGDGSISVGYMKKVLQEVGLTEEQYVALCNPKPKANWFISIFRKVFRNEKVNQSKNV